MSDDAKQTFDSLAMLSREGLPVDAAVQAFVETLSTDVMYNLAQEDPATRAILSNIVTSMIKDATRTPNVNPRPQPVPSSSSSAISDQKKQTWADITEEDEEKKASASEEGCKGGKDQGGKGRGCKGQGGKDQGGKDQGGKDQGGKGRGGKGRGGKDQGGKGRGRGRGGKGVEPATGPSKPRRPNFKPTTACAHLVLGGIPKCPYEASGKCTFLHEGIFQDSGQPTGWLEVTPGTWTGQKEGEFGISVATGGVVQWDTETYAYEKSSSEEFMDFLADRTVWKSKNS